MGVFNVRGGAGFNIRGGDYKHYSLHYVTPKCVRRVYSRTNLGTKFMVFGGLDPSSYTYR